MEGHVEVGRLKLKYVDPNRPRGRFSRQLVLGDNLDLDGIEADYQGGVLRLVVPVAERAKPRKIQLSSSGEERTAIQA